MRLQLLLPMAWLILPSIMPAQTSIQGMLSGTITDPTGAAVPRVGVVAQSEGKKVEFRAESTDSGVFIIPGVMPGAYTITFQKQGFRLLVREGIAVSVNQTAVVNVTLAVGEVAETVTVQADASPVQTQTTELSLVVQRKSISELPLNGKDFQKLMFLAPGVGGQRATNTNTNNSISGAREGSNNYVLDGVSANDEREVAGLPLGASSRQLPNVISTESLEEFRVITSNADAAFGRGAGGQINAITRSGSNDWHGSAYEFLRNDAMDSRDFFNRGPFFDSSGRAVTPPFRQNLFGGSLGGPIQRNKHFVFGNFEGFRQRLELTSAVTLPNADLVRLIPGDLGRLSRGFYLDTGVVPAGEVAGVRPFADADRRAAIAAGFSSALFDGDVSNGEAGSYLTSRSSTSDFRQNSFLVRTDHIFSPRVRLMARYAEARNRADTNTATLPGTGTTTPASYHSPTAQLVLSPSATQLLELRGSVTRKTSDIQILDGLPGPLASLGVAPEAGIAIAAAGITFQLPSIAPFVVRDNQTTPQLAVQHTLSRGTLIVRTGIDLRRVEVNFRNNTFPRPSWQFSGLVGPNGILGPGAGAAQPVAASVSQTVFGTNGGPTTPQRGWISTQQEYFAQADWRVRRNITANLGLRYSYFGVYRERFNALSNLYAEQNGQLVEGVNPFAFGRLANRVAPISDDLGLYSPDRNNFQPRLGLAWTPRDRTVLRAAYGLYVDRIYQLPLSNLANNVPFATARSGTQIPFRIGDVALTAAARPVLFGVDPAIRNPYMHRFSLALEQQISSGTTVSAAYVGSMGRKLIRTDEPNLAGAFPQALRPEQRFSDQRILSNLSSSDYDSLQVTAVRRFARGVSFTSTYTYSSYRDDSSTDFFAARPTLINLDASAVGGIQGGTRLAPRPVTADYGRSENDAPHVFVTSVVAELPFGKGRKWGANLHPMADAILGGWSLSGLLQIRSGPPFDTTLGTDVNDDGYFADRPALLSGSASDLYRQTGEKTQFLLPAAEARQRLGDPRNVADPFATLPRNALRGDRMEIVDASVSKRFALSERLRLNIEANVFNVLNRATFAVPNSTLSSPFFGVVTGTLRTATPRQVQLGAKVTF